MLKDIVPKQHNKCPKCKGLLMFTSDRYGPYLDCTRCGKHFDLSPKPDRVTMSLGPPEKRPVIRDTGCEESPTCITCPLPFCKYENRAGRRKLVTQRDTRHNAPVTRYPAGVPVTLVRR